MELHSEVSGVDFNIWIWWRHNSSYNSTSWISLGKKAGFQHFSRNLVPLPPRQASECDVRVFPAQGGFFFLACASFTLRTVAIEQLKHNIQKAPTVHRNHVQWGHWKGVMRASEARDRARGKPPWRMGHVGWPEPWDSPSGVLPRCKSEEGGCKPRVQEKHGLGARGRCPAAYLQILAFPPTSCMIGSKLHGLSTPQFSHL